MIGILYNPEGNSALRTYLVLYNDLANVVFKIEFASLSCYSLIKD